MRQGRILSLSEDSMEGIPSPNGKDWKDDSVMTPFLPLNPGPITLSSFLSKYRQA